LNQPVIEQIQEIPERKILLSTSLLNELREMIRQWSVKAR
jgi:hypothetical protein